jgi:hypothetical protein
MKRCRDPLSSIRGYASSEDFLFEGRQAGIHRCIDRHGDFEPKSPCVGSAVPIIEVSLINARMSIRQNLDDLGPLRVLKDSTRLAMTSATGFGNVPPGMPTIYVTTSPGETAKSSGLSLGKSRFLLGPSAKILTCYYVAF